MREPAMRANGRSGFTLVEIMVVVVIIGILATFFIVRIVGRGDKARVDTTKAMLVQIASQLDIFKLDHGRYPDALEDLLVQPNYVKPENWPSQPYLNDYPTDGWKNKLVYRRGTTSAKPFELYSLGADGQEGGSDLDTDLYFGESARSGTSR